MAPPPNRLTMFAREGLPHADVQEGGMAGGSAFGQSPGRSRVRRGGGVDTAMARHDLGDRTENLATVALRQGGGDGGEREGHAPQRGGLAAEAVARLPERL